MRGLLYTFSILAVVALGFWAYREGYETRATARAVEQLQRQIGARHEEVAMLRAEWAYLNRPDRLRELAEMNFERLGLMPLSQDHFATVDQIAFPLPRIEDPALWSPDGVALQRKLSGITDTSSYAGASGPSRADDGEQFP